MLGVPFLIKRAKDDSRRFSHVLHFLHAYHKSSNFPSALHSNVHSPLWKPTDGSADE